MGGSPDLGGNVDQRRDRATDESLSLGPPRTPEFIAWLGSTPAPELLRCAASFGAPQRFGAFWLWSHTANAERFGVSKCATGQDEPTTVQLTSRGGIFDRAVGGGAPVHYAEVPSGVLVASTLLPFIQGLGLAQAHELATAFWFGGRPTFPQGQTPLAGVKSLPPGTILHVTSERKLWVEASFHPPAQSRRPPRRELFLEHAAALREELSGVIARECPRDETLVFYSGGVDSGLLAALAAAQGKRLQALSVVPSGYAADAPWERALVERPLLTRSFRAHSVLELDQRRWIDALQQAPAAPFPIVYHPSLLLLQTSPRHPLNTVLRGEFADEAFGSRLRVGDWLDAHSVLQILSTTPDRWPLGWRTPLSKLKRQWLARRSAEASPMQTLPRCFRGDLRDEYAAWRRALGGARRALGLLDLRDGILTEAWESAGQKGYHSVFPFMHRRVLELAYSLHPAELLGSGTKRVLRVAGRGVSLEAHRLRADKGVLRAASPHRTFPLPRLSAESEALLCPRWLDDASANGVGPADALRLSGIEHMMKSYRSLREQYEDDVDAGAAGKTREPKR